MPAIIGYDKPYAKLVGGTWKMLIPFEANQIENGQLVASHAGELECPMTSEAATVTNNAFENTIKAVLAAMSGQSVTSPVHTYAGRTS